MNDFRRLLPPQAVLVYKTLLKEKELTANELGERLNIFPNTVYRVVRSLEKFGMIEKINTRPLRFRAKQAEEVVDAMLLSHREWFLNFFDTGDKGKVKIKNDLGITFIKNRDEFVERSTQDQICAVKEVFLIISGDEVPSETILASKRAIERGVVIRVIAQRIDDDNREMLKNWEKIGMKVRYSPTIKTRITIIDLRIVYIVSYNPKDYKEGIGVRFNYPPVAAIMREMFMKKWKGAKAIS